MLNSMKEKAEGELADLRKAEGDAHYFRMCVFESRRKLPLWRASSPLWSESEQRYTRSVLRRRRIGRLTVQNWRRA